MLLRPNNAGVPQCVYDGIVHDGVWLAPLALHCLERLHQAHPLSHIAAITIKRPTHMRLCTVQVPDLNCRSSSGCWYAGVAVADFVIFTSQ